MPGNSKRSEDGDFSLDLAEALLVQVYVGGR